MGLCVGLNSSSLRPVLCETTKTVAETAVETAVDDSGRRLQSTTGPCLVSETS